MSPHLRKTLVVAGHGMVGHRFVQAAVERGLTETYDLVVVGDEPRVAYDRVALTSFFEVGADELSFLPTGAYDDPRVRLVTGTEVEGFDTETRTVLLSGGEVIGYDELVLATGAAPFVPPIPGHDLDGCFVYRTIEDLEAIRDAAQTATVGAVIGGGLLGLEAANALAQLGLETHVVEMAPRLMAVQVDDAGGATLARHIEQLGLTVHTGAATERVLGEERVTGLALKDGDLVSADIVVFSAGIRPCDSLARDAGLDLAERGGVLVDERCRTSDEHVWAIGECAAPGGRMYGLVAPGYAMAEVVVDALLGGPGSFTGADMSTKLKLMGVDVASFGDAFAATEGALELVFSDAVAGVYKKLVVSADGKQLLGGILVGDASAYGVLRPMVASGIELPDNPEELILPAGRGSGDEIGLPAEAVVCSCNNVTKAEIVTAAADGTTTRAGTTCGSCKAQTKKIIEDYFVSQGKVVDTSLCEHFALTRQELFDVVAVHGYTRFDDIVEAHGTGRGCDVCKPVIASILATQLNGHVLAGDQRTLQDTNDAYLANIQRNGTYSVMPRIAGGEITPEKLIVIGEVAQEFDLYTKITGGQRIDLLGARMEQLPAIWRRLVDAGFESGHAYGKSLRTVKSCVGSTWCRYGVQDSTGLAIELEHRYRGLRSPHKIKAGVSGCARECAEARSKDFGVIATEKGWNLYVAGNGGSSPVHARLLAGDLDRETLIRYIDRFLMYYVRTADRLQRTAPWVDSLDGGLDRVREVVVDDALGLGSELEAAMAKHVDTYFDEWKATLDDPEKLARFVSFVNAPDTPDPNITFTTERGQVQPADSEGPVSLGSTIPVGAPR
ncbi:MULTISPECIES: nitrite reductase large subunit NirB [unclassified Nocardioides]|uniref:nitrite reductase large subunit NirB n=1 Tax=unclassified Nocardioides TaxID=2615069 RepID=UPI0009F00C32|nr:MULTISPECIES: nitrite reductase large subunit NirB [unclassified Nocardioides]GAW50293.1 nitrite reductase (NAD(P)H) large subunit [Nocardioides sp. PD653-B2]GAW53015.1 nitrite reductase (NAD(P)H) large subunit [Nocardioides sp. PD653]